jgi:hypothetical protein
MHVDPQTGFMIGLGLVLLVALAFFLYAKIFWLGHLRQRKNQNKS